MVYRSWALARESHATSVAVDETIVGFNRRVHFRHSSCVPGRICENRRRQSKVSLVLCRPGPTTVWSPAGHKVFGNLVLPVEGRRSPRKTSTTRRTSQVSWHKPGSPRDTGQVARGPKDGLDGSDQGRQRSLSSLPGRTGRSRPAEKLPHFSGSRVSPLSRLMIVVYSSEKAAEAKVEFAKLKSRYQTPSITTPPKPSPDFGVFISYARQDWDKVSVIFEGLKDREGLKVFCLSRISGSPVFDRCRCFVSEARTPSLSGTCQCRFFVTEEAFTWT